MQIDPNDYKKQALMGALGGGVPTPPNGNTGVAGAAPPSAPMTPGPTVMGPPSSPINDGPDAPITGPTAAPKPASPFQSQNKSVRGYLDEAVKFNAGNIKGIADEAGRKSANESFLRSLIPEIEARGGSISDIRGDKARVDGRMIDFYRDIEGAADPQYLDVTDEGGGPAMGAAMGGGGGFGGVPLGDALNGDPLAKIQQALSQFSQSSPNLDALLAQLGGGQ